MRTEKEIAKREGLARALSGSVITLAELVVEGEGKVGKDDLKNIQDLVKESNRFEKLLLELIE